MEPHDRDSCEHLEHDAILADLARPLVHEFNNFLNSLLLQIALLQAKSLDGAEPAGLASLRKDAMRIAACLQEWQSLPRYRHDEQQRIDVNQAVQAVLPEHGKIALRLSPEPLWARCSLGELRRLLTLLIHVSIRHADARGIEVRTEPQPGHAVLALHSRGADWSPQALEEAFQLTAESGCGLTLAGCKSLTDRLHGRLESRNHPDGGLLLTLTLADNI